MAQFTVLEVDVHTVRSMQETGREFLLLDCREPDEHAFANIVGSQLIPMNELPARLHELGDDVTRPIIVYCHHGQRSLRVTQWLRNQGWIHAQNMAGGIDAWSVQVDPSLPRY